MRKDKEYQHRKFGQITIKVSYTGRINIVGPSSRITGVIYNNAIKDFKKSKINPVTNQVVQVIGLDDQLSAQKPINWLYQKIRDGKFDHLIE